MNTVTIQPEFNVSIPSEICQSLHWQPGQRLQIVQINDRIELLPYRSLKEARGFLRGIDTTIEREPDRV